MSSKFVLMSVCVALVSFFGLNIPEATAANRVRTEILLRSSGVVPSAKGKARYEVRSDKADRRKLSVQAENLFIAEGATATLLVDGNTIATSVVTLGKAKFERTTELGHIVPNIVPGTLIQVIINDKLIVSGKF